MSNQKNPSLTKYPCYYLAKYRNIEFTQKQLKMDLSEDDYANMKLIKRIYRNENILESIWKYSFKKLISVTQGVIQPLLP